MKTLSRSQLCQSIANLSCVQHYGWEEPFTFGKGLNGYGKLRCVALTEVKNPISRELSVLKRFKEPLAR